MGGAFVALADDPYALYWNPAGTVITPQMAVTYSSLLNNRSDFSFTDYLAFNWCSQGWQPPGDLAWAEMLLKLGGVLFIHDALKELLGDRPQAQPENQEKKSAEKIETPPSPPHPRPDPYWGWHYYYWGSPYYHQPRHRHDNDENDKDPDKALPPPVDEETNKEALAGRYYLEALGFSYQHNYNYLAAPDQNRSGDWYNLAIGYRWRDSPWAWGLNIRLDTETIVQSWSRYNASCLEMDLGVLWRATDKLALGLLIQDFLNTRLAWSPDLETAYATNIRLGASYQPVPNTILAAQVSNLLATGNAGRQYHLGLEQGLCPWLVWRCGLLNRDWTAGGGIDLWGVKLDYAYLSGVSGRHILGVTWRF